MKHRFTALAALLAAALLAACAAPTAGPPPPLAPAAGPITIAAVGDIMMGTENLLPADGGAGTFAAAAPFMQGRDLVFGNLEGPLTDRGAPSKNVEGGRSFVFRSPPGYVRHLKAAGFNIVSLANNHANDYGPEGRAQTRRLLDEAGIAQTGGPGEIATLTAGGRPAAFIALAPNAGCQNLNDLPAAEALVRKAAQAAALVIVSVHGGAEGADKIHVPDGPETFLGENRGDLRRLSHALIDAGADLVIGHGPHVPRGLELYKGRLIAYSLGNFATAAGIRVTGPNGLAPLLLVNLAPDGSLAGGQVISFRQYRAGQPQLDASSEAARLMRRVSVEDFTAPGLGEGGRLLTPGLEAVETEADSNMP